MVVDTKKVEGRRTLRFETFDEILADAERLAATSSVRKLGNWSLGQSFFHLAAGMRLMLDGSKTQAPLLARLVGPVVKFWMLNRSLPAGFKLPKASADELIAEREVSTVEGLEALCSAVARMKVATEFQPHPIFGPMNAEQARKLQCRHSELHLSFFVPEEGA